MTEHEIISYRLGFTQGEEVGYRRAEHDMAREWPLVAERVKAMGRTPTAVELATRRKPGGPAYETALRRRGGREYQGGPVDFHTGQPIIREVSA